MPVVFPRGRSPARIRPRSLEALPNDIGQLVQDLRQVAAGAFLKEYGRKRRNAHERRDPLASFCSATSMGNPRLCSSKVRRNSPEIGSGNSRWIISRDTEKACPARIERETNSRVSGKALPIYAAGGLPLTEHIHLGQRPGDHRASYQRHRFESAGTDHPTARIPHLRVHDRLQVDRGDPAPTRTPPVPSSSRTWVDQLILFDEYASADWSLSIGLVALQEFRFDRTAPFFPLGFFRDRPGSAGPLACDMFEGRLKALEQPPEPRRHREAPYPQND